MTKLLVIGSGGREHAIAWAVRQTSRAGVDVHCAPGNGGIGQIAQLVPASDAIGLAGYAEAERIDLTFVGPEAPLAAGVVDLFEASEFVKSALGADVAEHYAHFYRSEQRAFERAVTDWERRRYFERI